MAICRRGVKLESTCSYVLREFGKSLCFPCRSYSNSERPVLRLHNSVTRAELSLVGIDHVSPKSAEFVQHVIRESTPNVVAVELCKQRGTDFLSPKEWKSMTWSDFWAREGGLGEKITEFILNEVYVRLAGKGFKPGDELRVAILEGSALGAKVVYMDQDMDVTLKRVSEEFSLWKFIQVILQRREIAREFPHMYRLCIDWKWDQLQFYESTMHPEVHEDIIKFGEKYFPGLVKSLVEERNEFMVKKLRRMRGKIVGVVGALHLDGMHKLWKDAELQSP